MKTVFSIIFIAVIIASVIAEFIFIYSRYFKNTSETAENGGRIEEEQETNSSGDTSPDCPSENIVPEESVSEAIIEQAEAALTEEINPEEPIKNSSESAFDRAIAKLTLSKKSVCIITVVTAVACIALFFLTPYYKENYSILNGFVNAEILGWLTAIGIVDLKKKKIPNVLILAGLVFWVAVTVLDIIVGKTPVKEALVFSLLGGGICGAILFIVSILSKGALGMGDVKLFTVIGLLFGIFKVYSVLLWTVIIMAVVSIALMIAKKADRKTRIPMAPFAVLGFLLEFVMGV